MQTIEQLREKAKKIKLIVSDMDGTMLDDEKVISDANIAAVKEICESGLLFSLATGRMCSTLKRFGDQLNLSGYVIGTNGAEIVEFPNMRVQKRLTIDFDTAMEIVCYCEQNDIDYCCECVGEYWLSANSAMMPIFTKGKQKSLKESGYDYFVGCFSDKTYSEIKNKELMKIFIKCADEDKSRALAAFAASIRGVSSTSSANEITEIIADGAQKGSALKELAEQLELERDEICAIGDYDNDIEMIEFAGLSIAMGNAVPKVKLIADYVTKTNNQSGVAEALKELFLYE